MYIIYEIEMNDWLFERKFIMSTMINGGNGGNANEHAGTHAIEFFGKAGSLFVGKGNAYGSASALDLFKEVWRAGDHVTAMKLLFWLRDPRGGAGNRSGFRAIATWLADEAPEWMIANVVSIPKYGRWDDLTALYDTKDTAHAASTLWANEIMADSVLAAKWATRADKKVLKALRKVSDGSIKDIGDYRRKLAGIRKGVVEVSMSKKEYSGIDYSHVPSVAMARYNTAFGRNDEARYGAYKTTLEKAIETGDKSVKINTGAIFPHDVIRASRNSSNKKAQDLQFASLPNFMEESDARIMVLADTSGSMGCVVGGDVRAVDVSQSLALYCSDKLGKDNPFYRKYMQFAGESTLTDWSDKKYISEVLDDRKMFNRAIASTNVTKALTTLVKYGKMFNATSEQMPTHLLIISDMQFDSGTESPTQTVVEAALAKWSDAGYEVPSIVYWNTNGNAGTPARGTTPNTALVSGFSPSILKAVFGNPNSMNPINIMNEAIKDYTVVVPK